MRRPGPVSEERVASNPAGREHVYALFHGRTRHQLHHRQAKRYPAVRQVFLGDDGPRRLLAMQPVRGGVRFRGAHGGTDSADGFRGARSTTGVFAELNRRYSPYRPAETQAEGCRYFFPTTSHTSRSQPPLTLTIRGLPP